MDIIGIDTTPAPDYDPMPIIVGVVAFLLMISLIIFILVSIYLWKAIQRRRTPTGTPDIELADPSGLSAGE